MLSELTGNKGTEITESQLKDVLKKYFVNSEIPEELPNDLSSLQLTALKNENYKIKVSEIYDGKLASNMKVTESYGLSDDGTYFIGQLTDEAGRTCNGNVEYENGYKFTQGNFLEYPNYPSTDETMYVCWDDDPWYRKS